jgi:hypothetical protein
MPNENQDENKKPMDPNRQQQGNPQKQGGMGNKEDEKKPQPGGDRKDQ